MRGRSGRRREVRTSHGSPRYYPVYDALPGECTGPRTGRDAQGYPRAGHFPSNVVAFGFGLCRSGTVPLPERRDQGTNRPGRQGRAEHLPEVLRTGRVQVARGVRRRKRPSSPIHVTQAHEPGGIPGTARDRRAICRHIALRVSAGLRAICRGKRGDRESEEMQTK